MRLRLQNFRCYREETIFEWREGLLYLIKGPSGKGKSTIFQGIAWVLYGGAHHIFSTGAPVSQSCYGELNLSEVTIYRQKRPELLRVTQGERVYEDASGQALIDYLFGTKEVWWACCYLAQSTRNFLLGASQSDKMKLIHELSFNTEDPGQYLERIDEHLTDVRLQIKVKEALTTQLRQRLETALIETTHDSDGYLDRADTEGRKSLLEQLAQLVENIQKLREAEKTYYQYQGQCNHLIMREKELARSLASFEEYNTPRDNLVDELGKAQSILEAARRDTEFRTLQKHLDKLPPAWEETVTDEMLQEAQERQKARTRAIQEAAFLQTAYEPEIIKKAIEDTEQELTSLDLRYTQADLKLVTQRNEDQRFLEELGISYEESTLEDKIREVETRLALLPQWTPQELKEAKNQTQLQQTQQRLLAKYQLPYTEEGLQHLEFLSRVQKVRPLVKQYLLLTSQITSPIEDFDPQALLEVTRALSEETSPLTCPACHQHLKYRDDKLVLVGAPRTSEERAHLLQEQKRLQKIQYQEQLRTQQKEAYRILQERWGEDPTELLAHFEEYLPCLEATIPRSLIIVEPSYETMQNQLRDRDELVKLKTRLAAITITPSTLTIDIILNSLRDQEKEPSLRKKLTALTKLPIIPEHPTVEEVTNQLRRQELEEKLKKLQPQLPSFSISEKQALEKVHQCEEALRRYDQRQHRYYELRKEHEKLTKELKELQSNLARNIPEERANLEKEHQVLSQRWAAILHFDKLWVQQDELTQAEEQLYNYQLRAMALEKLKTAAIEVECQGLQQTVDSINQIVNDFAGMLFDDPITIKLALFKTLKTQGRVKPSVNLTIHYRGGEYDNINQLSGGEGDRISLVLTLALTRLSRFPFLLCDESLASLDSSLKETALHTIRQAITKGVLCINHEGVEGHYDEVIPL